MRFKPFALLAIVALALMAFASVAQATPTAPGYERFGGCPSPAENEEVFVCQRAVIDGGHFQMGSKDVPITSPITLSGGVLLDATVAFSSTGGLSPAKQKVPGGLVGLTGLTWLAELLGVEALTVYAVTELAGVPHLREFSQRLELPIKVHLVNPVLGNKCYVGSSTNPIKLNMTYGTTAPPPPNTPISGTPPTEGPETQTGVLPFENGVLVDNAFAAPAASGCVLTLLGFLPVSLDALVNLQSGLPSAAGHNETKQNLDLEIANKEAVYP